MDPLSVTASVIATATAALQSAKALYDRISVTVSWKIACPMIILAIVTVISGADFRSGFRSKILRLGGSVASARAANVPSS